MTDIPEYSAPTDELWPALIATQPYGFTSLVCERSEGGHTFWVEGEGGLETATFDVPADALRAALRAVSG